MKTPLPPNSSIQYSDIREIRRGEPYEPDVLNRPIYDLTYEMTQKYLDSAQLASSDGAYNVGVDSSNYKMSSETDVGSVLEDFDDVLTNVAQKGFEIITGTGLNGGGLLQTGSVTLSVDNTVVRTSGDQTLSGKKTFEQAPAILSNPIATTDVVSKGYVDERLNSFVSNGVVPKTRTITAGTGLNGGGSLASDVELTVDANWIQSRLNEKMIVGNLIAGNGLSGGGSLNNGNVSISINVAQIVDQVIEMIKIKECPEPEPCPEPEDETTDP